MGIQSKNSSEVNSSGAGASGINGSSSGGNNSGDIDSKLIERVAIEFNQLQFLVHSVQGLPFVQGVEWRINRIKDSLTSHLSHALESAYQSRLQQSLSATASSSTTSLTTATASNQYDLSQILRTYVLIDKIREAEAVFGSCCVAPFISKVIIIYIDTCPAEYPALLY